jgi:hypothetical protein
MLVWKSALSPLPVAPRVARSMAYHFEFDSEHRILLAVLEGDVEGTEIERINDDIRAHVARMKPFAGISDFAAVKEFNVPSQSMRAAALQPSPYPPETPRYIIAPTDFLFGMARMYEIFANRPHDKLHVVRSWDEALAAVGVKDAKFERLE